MQNAEKDQGGEYMMNRKSGREIDEVIGCVSKWRNFYKYYVLLSGLI
jgi:hypothetical protein